MAGMDELLANDPYGYERTRQLFADDEPTPEEASIMATLGQKGLSALQTIGHVLDTPGAAVRLLLSGRNPLDALDPDSRISGKELLGYDKSDDSWGSFLAGLATEIATDPLTFVGGAGLLGKSVSNAGKVAERAGLLSRLTTGAYKSADVGLGTGIRSALIKTTPRKLLDSLPVAERAAAEAKFADTAFRMGHDATSLLDKPLGGAFRAHVPFTNLEYMPAGSWAQKYAAGRDAVGEAIRYGGKYNPIPHLAGLFGTENRTLVDPVAQRLAHAATAAETERLPQALDALFASEGNLTRQGLRDIPVEELRRAAEFPAAAPQALREALAPLHKEFETLDAVGRQRNLGTRTLNDPAGVGYWPRQFDPSINQPASNNLAPGRSLLGGDATLLQRKLLGIQGGTETINKAAQQAAQILEAGGTKDDIQAMLLTMGIPESVAVGKRSVKVLDNLTDTLTGVAATHGPEALKQGLFTNNPLFDAAKALPGMVRTGTTRDTLLKAFGDETFLKLLENPRYASEPAVPIAQALEQWKLPVGAMDTIASELTRQTGKAVSASDVAGRIKIPQSIVEQLGRADQPISGPRAAKGLLGAFDKATDLFKVGMLTHPARHVRDLFSGQVQNVFQGQFGGQRAAMAVIKGGVLKDAAEYAKLPAVKDALRGQAATAENVTDVLRQMSAARGVVQPLGDIGDVAQGIGRGTLAEVSKRVPGRTPAVLPGEAEWFKALVGKAKGTELLPITPGPKGSRLAGAKVNVRALGGDENTFGLLRASDQASYAADAANRLGPWLKLVKQGVDPTVAAERVASSQVKYANALTPFETSVMARLAPFYRFSKGATKHVAGELYNNPGGRLANLLRAQRNLLSSTGEKSGPVPEHVQEKMAIPITPDSVLSSILGMPKDSKTRRYLTGLGLMHEDSLKLLDPLHPGKATLEALSRTNPFVKAAIELPLGRSTFQRGPEGGRALEELDPTIGRTLGNIMGLESPVGTPRGLEYLAGMSPLSRLLSTGRVLTDPRKDALNKAINTLTGVRTTDVSPATEDAMLRQALNAVMRESGAKTARQEAYFSKADMERMTPRQRAEAERYMAIRKLLNRRQKTRAKEKAAL